MSTTRTHVRLGLAVALSLAGVAIAAPAYAGPPAGAGQVVMRPAAPLCPTVSASATRLRADGFAAPAAKNFGIFVRDDCVAEDG
jgi:hypothetical protein